MKLTTVIGARPQFIKAAYLSRLLPDFGIQERLLHTGQHYDQNMSEVFFDELKIPSPSQNFGISGMSHAELTSQMLVHIARDIEEFVPDALLVYGDTDSTLAGALAAAKLHIPIIHVESGLRSYDKDMPEEINRVLTDHLSTLLLCPTKTAVKNLANENISNGVHLVGDVMKNVLESVRPIAIKKSSIIEQLQIQNLDYVVATIHRAENTDFSENLLSIMRALEKTEFPVILPLHPRTDAALKRYNWQPKGSNLRLIKPLSYIDMVALVSQSKLVLTDSGGLQKEAVWLGKQCVTLRENTEWVETVKSGWNIIAGSNESDILSSLEKHLRQGVPKEPMSELTIDLQKLIDCILEVKE